MRLHKLRSLNEWLIISASFEPDADDSYDSIAVVLKFFHLCCLPIDDNVEQKCLNIKESNFSTIYLQMKKV